ncbi:MAG: VWA domain-containing protein, partial [Verrucomicrobiales bacterium]|nr:VWA domain-containing protein [Verrucomicrobiales bacterium]
MSALTPWALAFGLTLPVVILFYLLKRRRVVLRVPSTVLWRRYLAETQANAPFQRLRWTWLLLLQLLLLLLAVGALVRPFLPGQERPSSLRILVLDASASMQSRDVEPSRFEAARSEARKWIDSLKPGQRMVLLQAGPRTEVRQSATSDRAALRRALESCVVTDGGSRVGEALKMAESLIRDVADPEIHLFSDGAVGLLDEFENRNLPLVFHRVGVRRHNVAFSSLEVRANPENPQQRAVFTALANLSPAEIQTQVELRFDGEVVDAQQVTVAPGESEPLVFIVNQERDGLYTVRHTAADDLPSDNQATVMSLLPQPVRVLLVTRGNRFLEKALRSAGTVQLTVAADMTGEDADWDFVVLDAVTPTRWPEVNTLALRTSAPGWFDEIAALNAPPIVEWRTAHPLLRFVNLDNVQVAEAAGIRAPPWGEVVAATTQGPLLVAGDQGRRRVVWVGFDVLRSTWPLRVSFPMFVANVVEYL